MGKMSTITHEVDLKFQKLFSTITPLNLTLDEEDEWMAKMEENLRSNFCTSKLDDIRPNEAPCNKGSESLEYVSIDVRELANKFQTQMMKQVCTFTKLVLQQKELTRDKNTEKLNENLTSEMDKARLVVQIQSLMAFNSNKLNEYWYQFTINNKSLHKNYE